MWYLPAVPAWSARPGLEAGVHGSGGPAGACHPFGLPGVREFPGTAAGYSGLLGWLGGFGTVCLGEVEGTGSYGAGLARHVTAAGIGVVEAGRSDRQDRRRPGKSGPLDAVSAARAAQSGRARGAPGGRDGAVEAIGALMVARRSAAGERTRTISQARAPDLDQARFTRHARAALVAGLASLRPRPGDVAGYAVRGLGAPARCRPNCRIIGQTHSSPAQSRRRPPGQPCLGTDRVHPAGL